MTETGAREIGELAGAVRAMEKTLAAFTLEVRPKLDEVVAHGQNIKELKECDGFLWDAVNGLKKDAKEDKTGWSQKKWSLVLIVGNAVVGLVVAVLLKFVFK